MRTFRRRRRVTPLFGDQVAPVPAEDAAWSVYVLTDDARKSFSISMGREVIARTYRHRQEVRTSDEPKRKTPRLVYVEPFACRHTALAKMRRMRLWPVTELRRVIGERNPRWEDLYRDPFGDAA
ncbi:MAG: hypothetical protein V2I43_16980 [Parvularcula sp.]|jgi:predicted GIY-YIG superfamily endonuclease|nr:hypothetical protein [Parvularcula sp.]